MTKVFRFCCPPEAAQYIMHYEHGNENTIAETWPTLTDSVLQHAAARAALRVLAKRYGFKLVRVSR